ncbi:hypothetical protein D9M70_556500 [compost metagenome]
MRGQVLRTDAVARLQAMDDPAGAEVGSQVHGADGRAIGVVVQRRVGMGTGMRRQGDAADVDRTVLVDPPAAFFLERRIARPGRGTAVQWRADIPQHLAFTHDWSPLETRKSCVRRNRIFVLSVRR